MNLFPLSLVLSGELQLQPKRDQGPRLVCFVTPEHGLSTDRAGPFGSADGLLCALLFTETKCVHDAFVAKQVTYVMC